MADVVVDGPGESVRSEVHGWVGGHPSILGVGTHCLQVLAYNLKRVSAILGPKPLTAAIRA
jgi:hypothetical protein